MRFLIGLALAAAVAPGAAAGAEGRDFKPLVSGSALESFRLVGIGPETVTMEGDEVRVSGKPNGYFATKGSYKNYVLRFDWRYERPDGLASDAAFLGNSGLLLHIKEHKVWPESIEVQLLSADAGNTFAIPPAKFRGRTDSAAQRKAVRPVGQWNALEVTCKGGTVVVVLNGVEVARGTNATPDHGPIGWQSEGTPIRFRKLMIKALE